MNFKVMTALAAMGWLLAGCDPAVSTGSGPPVDPNDPCNGVPAQICPRQ